jgi:hypothetical protein
MTSAAFCQAARETSPRPLERRQTVLLLLGRVGGRAERHGCTKASLPRVQRRYDAVADVVMANDWQVVVTVQRERVVTHTACNYFAHY